MKAKLLCLLIAVILLVPTVAHGADAPALGTEILWDTWGVPHIFAEDNSSLFYAFGWAQMHNHADLILQLYAHARGEAAQYWGEAFLDSDRLMHTVGVPEIGQTHYEAQNEEFKGYVDAFVAGMNAYAEANPGAIGDEVKPVLPVRVTDPLTLAYNDVTIAFVAGSAVGVSQAWNAGQLGSNAWAIAPERSASGNAMLVVNPHLPWSDIFTLFEAHLIAPGVNLYGATLVGLPGIELGFNERLGWTHTVNTYDGFDLYELTLTEGDGYLLDGEKRTFDIGEKTIKVLDAGGSLTEQTFPVLRSVHGPVIALNDADAHIYYLFNGQIPVRDGGDFDSWLAIQPGDDSSLIWNTYHPYEDLPKLTDPETGFLQNANETPWTSTIPPALEIADFPPYFAPQGYWWDYPFRAMTSQQMLAEDESITFDELVAYKHSTHVEVADHLLDDLIAIARESNRTIVQEAANVFESWDRSTDAESRGAVLFIHWFETYTQRFGLDMFAIPFDISDPFDTPSGLNNPGQAVAILQLVAEQVKLDYGALDVPYGDVMRVRVGEYDLPGNGPGDPNGVFRAAWYTPAENRTYQLIGGDSWVAVIEFSNPVRAHVLLGQGNATQPGSPHVGDQLTLFSAKALREPWLTREDIEANVEEVKQFR